MSAFFFSNRSVKVGRGQSITIHADISPWHRVQFYRFTVWRPEASAESTAKVWDWKCAIKAYTLYYRTRTTAATDLPSLRTLTRSANEACSCSRWLSELIRLFYGRWSTTRHVIIVIVAMAIHGSIITNYMVMYRDFYNFYNIWK